MKRIFLTSGLIICMACPAFATKDLDTSGHAQDITNGKECVEPVLGVYDAPQESPVQLEAKWNANQYTIAFAKGQAGNHTDTSYITGTTDSITPVTFESTNITLANGFSATGYHFTGWSSPVNLATGATGTTPYNGTAGNHNANYTSPVLATYGYDAPVADNRTVTLTAQWAANTYNVIYHAADQIVCDANSACTSGAFTQTNGATYDAQYSVLSLANAHMSANTGYTFLGWSTDSAATVTRTGTSNAGTFTGAYTGANPWTRTSDLDLYAVYLANNYTVTYAEGTHGTGAGSTDTLTYDQAYSIKTLANAGVAAAAGYHFTEWSGSNSQTYDDVDTIAANTITSNLTLTAQYAANGTTISYSCVMDNTQVNNESVYTGTAPTTNTSATYNTTFAFAANTNCARPGWVFDGWTCTAGNTTLTQADVFGANAVNGSSTVIPAGGTALAWLYTGADQGSISCVAHYSANTINVNWYKNAGSDDSVVLQNTCIYDGSLAVPQPNPTRNGYQFNGWTVRGTSQN